MKLFFVEILFIATVSYVNGYLAYHSNADGRSLGNLTTYAKQKCDYRHVTPFEGKTWWFCTKRGQYAIMGRVNAIGGYNKQTGLRCYTTEDCMFTKDSTDVCVNIENEVRACYLNPFTHEVQPEFRTSFALLVLEICSSLRTFLIICMSACAILMGVAKRGKRKAEANEKKKKQEEEEKKEEPKEKKE